MLLYNALAATHRYERPGEVRSGHMLLTDELKEDDDGEQLAMGIRELSKNEMIFREDCYLCLTRMTIMF